MGHISLIMKIKHILADCRASVAVMAALSLPVVLGMMGLVVDLNRGYEQRISNQRAADMAALGAAMAYKTTPDTKLLNPTAHDLAVANGLTDANVTASVIENYPEAGKKAVRVVVARAIPYTLASILGFSGSFTVEAASIAALNNDDNMTSPCLLALSNESDAIRVSGGASINAPDCSVAAVGTIDNQGQLIRGAEIISGSGDIKTNWGELAAEKLRYAGSLSFPSWKTDGAPGAKRINTPTTLADPFANDIELTAARRLLGSYTAIVPLQNPDTPGGDLWKFDRTPSPAVIRFSSNANNTEFTVPAGNYNIGQFQIGSSIKVKFENGSTIRIANGLSVGGGSTLIIGDADLYVNGGFDTGDKGISIGNGRLWIGNGSVNFKGENRKADGDVTINAKLAMGGGQKLFMGEGTHKFGALSLAGGGSMALGKGDFTVSNGIDIGGGSELAVSTGNVTLGRGDNGMAITLSGSALFFMEDGRFSADGSIKTNGGSRISFGKTLNHYINGDMVIAGAALFGAGRYTIKGDFTNGTGGTTWPYTSALTSKTYGETLEGVDVKGYDMAGVDVTFILGGALNLGGGAKTKLIAPKRSVSGGQIAELLLDSLTEKKTNWGAGAQNFFTGIVHLPKSEISMSGGSTTLAPGYCFSLIAYKMDISGGAATGSSCPRMKDGEPEASSGGIRLIG